MVPRGLSTRQLWNNGSCFSFFWVPDGSKTLQGDPKRALERPKSLQGCPQRRPKSSWRPPGGPKRLPGGSPGSAREAKTLKSIGLNVLCLWTAQGPRSHKSTPSGLKRPPRRPPGALQGPQDGSKTAQDRPKTAPGQSRDGRRAPRAAPDRPQGGPRRPYKFAQTGPNVFHNLSQERSGGTKRPPKQLQGAPGALRALLWGRFVPPFLS